MIPKVGNCSQNELSWIHFGLANLHIATSAG